MRSRVCCRAGLTLTLTLLAGAWAYAHHGFGAFDRTKPLSLTGVVKSAEWVNPHVIVYLDVKGDGGKVETWAIQTAPPNLLARSGVTRDALIPGAVFTATGYPPRADLTDFVFAPAAAASFVRSGHMLYTYDVKIVGSEPSRSATASDSGERRSAAFGLRPWSLNVVPADHFRWLLHGAFPLATVAAVYDRAFLPLGCEDHTVMNYCP